MGLHAWHQVISNNESHLQCAITCSLNDTLLQSTHPSDSLWQSSIPYQALSLQEQGPVSCAVLSTSLVIGVLVARNRNIDWWRGMSCIRIASSTSSRRLLSSAADRWVVNRLLSLWKWGCGYRVQWSCPLVFYFCSNPPLSTLSICVLLIFAFKSLTAYSSIYVPEWKDMFYSCRLSRCSVVAEISCTISASVLSAGHQWRHGLRLKIWKYRSVCRCKHNKLRGECPRCSRLGLTCLVRLLP